ncbi:MAG: thioredoxin family protein [Sphingobacteriaceae bacterium]|nr:thioredoxin family protein [Sphingobacteriaceae bacterium]
MAISVKTKIYSYQEYHQLVLDCSELGKTTGTEQTIERIEATKLNATRMNRIYKLTQINDELKNTVSKLSKIKWNWLIISETWCGDSAQNLPIIAKIAELNANISLQIILRDENSEIMDKYTTQGSRSIPKLICFDELKGKVVADWGPRPAAITKRVNEFKKANPNINHADFVKELHHWYAQDKGVSIQSDFCQFISDIITAKD